MANWIDKVIGFISPEAGAKREAWRQELELMRNYDAGDYSRLNAGWAAINDSAENTDRYSRDVVRARARDLERNSDMENSVISAFKRNIVGLGWTLQARTPDDALNAQIEEAWEEWCKKENCDVTHTQSFSQMLRMAVERKKVDGGILFQKCFMREPGVVPFRLQALEVDELDTTAMAPKKKGNRIVGGIEYNSYNKPEGYWIKQYDLGGYSSTETRYVPAKNMIFIYTKKRPTQVREMSDFAATIPRIRDANEFMTAVAVKQRIEACLSVFIKKQVPTSGIGRSGGGSRGHDISYEGKTLTPGMIREMNPGDDVQVVNPTGQATDAASFMKLFQRLIGAGQGLSYEATSRDMSQSNYSSARQGIVEDEQTYAEERELFVEFQNEVYETFVISGVLSGLFQIPNFWDPATKRKYLSHEWVAVPKDWIDPLKEVQAMQTAVKSGQKTFQQAAAENGKDWRDQIDDIAEVIRYGKEKGINLGGILYGMEDLEPAEEPDDAPQSGDPGGSELSGDAEGGSGESEGAAESEE